MCKGVWSRNLEHEGLQVTHVEKPSQDVIDRLKKAGFRWSSRQRLWYAKETPHRVEVLEQIAEYGGEVGNRLSFAEKMDAKVERADARAERYDDLAKRTEQKGHELHEQAHRMAEVIPFGQPVHGATDRNYRDKIHNKYGKAFQTLEKAEHFEHKAEVAAQYEDKTFDTARTLRRIDRLQKIVRSIELDIDKYITSWELDMLWFNSGRQDKRYRTLSRKTLEDEEPRKASYVEQIEYWKEQIKARGGKIWGKDDFQKGEIILTRHGKARVLKPNQKTVRVFFLDVPANDWTQGSDLAKIPYNELRPNCKEVA